jgi:hypothetical protein
LLLDVLDQPYWWLWFSTLAGILGGTGGTLSKCSDTTLYANAPAPNANPLLGLRINITILVVLINCIINCMINLILLKK